MGKEIVVVENPKSPEAEMFRNLRTNIQFMNAQSEKKVMIVTSTIPGEGKSFVSANLGAAFAQLDKKVLIIDTDMRKGRQYSLFNLKPKPGISNFLSGVVEQDFIGSKDDIRNYIQETDVENLFLIPAGNVPPNPSELLVSNKIQAIINDLSRSFDVIIFDAPPCLIVADALILARSVDFSIIVSAQNITRMEDLKRAKLAIENVGGKVAGVVLNKVQVTAKSYENNYYYGDNMSHIKPPKQRR